jgi:hypothetical protein
VTDSPADVARRLRRDADRDRHASRYWAGWRLELTFGPYELTLGPERATFARRVAAAAYEQLRGEPAPAGPEADAASLAAQRDRWHLSVSWRGGHPVESARLLLADLVAAIGVPEDRRESYQLARVFSPDGRQSPQVTHWTWRDPQEAQVSAEPARTREGDPG